MENGVEGVDCVTGVDVAAGVAAVAVDGEFAVALEETAEFGYDLCDGVS